MALSLQGFKVGYDKVMLEVRLCMGRHVRCGLDDAYVHALQLSDMAKP